MQQNAIDGDPTKDRKSKSTQKHDWALRRPVGVSAEYCAWCIYICARGAQVERDLLSLLISPGMKRHSMSSSQTGRFIEIKPHIT
jgi:hypothetical protein